MNHRIFERTLRPLAFRGAHPFECREILKTFFLEKDFGLGGFLLVSHRSELLLNGLVGSALPILDVIRCFYVLGLALSPASNRLIDNDGVPVTTVSSVGGLTHQKTLTSNRVRLPAELKHINKRRKRN